MTQTLGIREFRDNFTRIAREGGEAIVVKRHDRVVGWYVPARTDPATREAAYARMETREAEYRAAGGDPEAELASLGMDPDGNPLDEC